MRGVLGAIKDCLSPLAFRTSSARSTATGLPIRVFHCNRTNQGSPMTGNLLFAQLVQRFQNYADAAVLWVLLKEEADSREHESTVWRMASEQLCGTLSPKTAHRAFDHLREMGLISTRVHKNTKTLITVDRNAVLEFLRQPLPERLPALSQKRFAFLEVWAADSDGVSSPNEFSSADPVNDHSGSGTAASSSEPTKH